MSAGDPPPLITECPNCHTRFRVGESQLQMAHGRVRCGACLAVFAGVDHLLLDESQTPPPVTGEDNALDSVLAELAFDSPGSQASSASDAPRSADDWTSVSVDTQEFARDTDETIELPSAVTTDAFHGDGVETSGDPERRVTIEDALNDEQALRWWLEDELPSEQHPAGATSGADDGMVVQLSQLDSVADEELDLQSLVGAQEEAGDSNRALEALFDELPEDAEAGLQADVELDQPEAEWIDPDVDHPVVAEADSVPMIEAADAQELQAELPDLDALEFAEPDELESATPPLPVVEERSDEEPSDEEPLDSAAEAASLTIDSTEADELSVAAASDQPEPDADGLAERTAEQLQEAIDAAEPLVTRAMADAAARTSGAVELVEPPRRPPVTEAADAQPSSAPAQPEHSTSAAGERVDSELTAEAVDADSIERPATSWNSASFPETPAELVEGIAEEMAAAGQPEVEQEPSLSDRLRGSMEGFWGHAMALRAATLLAFVLLTAQILYWQFDDWSKTATLRPFYGAVCSVLGCELPVRRSVRELQSRKLAVRSHPDKADALLVDALIINEAAFEQPFPVIELQFMDIQQQLVGSYRLEPSAYLDGELAGSTALMAVRTPIHIDIDIPDPGPKAVNYQLQFR